jgi:hypothetical protein
MNIYDYIIIGSGISGLYTGLELLKKSINNFIILEKNSNIGGRIKTFPINNNRVLTGAGVGRKNDILLQNLLNDLNIKYSKGLSNFYYSDNLVILNIYNIINYVSSYNKNFYDTIYSIYPTDFCDHFYKTLNMPIYYTIDDVITFINYNIETLLMIRKNDSRDDFDILVYNNVKHIFSKIKDNLDYLINENIYKPTSFKNFCLQILDIQTYEIFIKNLSFTDYENEDAYFAINYYNFQDNFEPSELIYIKWDIFLHEIKNRLNEKIITDTELFDIEELNDESYNLICNKCIETDNKYVTKVNYFCKKIIFANNLDIINKFYDYSVIKNQPFLRVYCKLDTVNSQSFIQKLKINGSTIVDNQLCKIININRDDGIFMISYCDNNNAKVLNYYKENTDANKKIFEKLLIESFQLDENEILIEDIYCFYWKLGTHYFKFTKNEDIDELLINLQTPYDNIFVVGECVSKNQGWCEGALESVNNILNYL